MTAFRPRFEAGRKRTTTALVGLDSGPAAHVAYPSYASVARRTRCAPVGRGISHRTGAIGGFREHSF